MTLTEIAEKNRVRIRRDECGNQIIPGKNGHLYVENGRPMVCYSDDGRKKPLTAKQKTFAIRKLGSGLKRMKQEGDCEFIAEIDPIAIKTALFDVLRVKRLRAVSAATRAHLARISSQGTAARRYPALESLGAAGAMV